MKSKFRALCERSSLPIEGKGIGEIIIDVPSFISQLPTRTPLVVAIWSHDRLRQPMGARRHPRGSSAANTTHCTPGRNVFPS